MLRRLALPVMLLALAGCAAPAGGGLWAGQAVRLEEQSYRLSDQQRAEGAWQSQQRLIGGWLGGQADWLGAALAVCPGGSLERSLERTVVRDGVRARLAADAEPAHGPAGQWLLAAVRQSALADWHLRRAAASGDAAHCQSARTALESLDRALAAAGGASRAPETRQASPGAPRVAVRADSIEALPLALARRIGAANLALVDVGSANPVDAVGGTADAAVGTSVDLLLSGRSDLVDAYNVFDRAPMAVAARASGDALARLVLAPAARRPLERGLARWLQTSASLPRGVAGGDPLSLLTWYQAGAVDGVLASAPWPQYLAATYGGAIVWDAADETAAARVGAGSLFVPATAGGSQRDALVAAARGGVAALRSMAPEDLADAVLADFPDWEPDAVLDLVRVARRCLNASGRLDQAAADRAAELAALAGVGQP